MTDADARDMHRLAVLHPVTTCANCTRHAGHVGACLPPHAQRMVDEHRELSNRIERLNTFMMGGVFGGLDVIDKSLLEMQRTAMISYMVTLTRRIERATV
jgi:hypothetical protein